MVGQLGPADSPPIAPPPEPVDRYQLMREFRKRARQGIAFWRIRDQIEAAQKADQEAEATAGVEEGERRAAQEAEQRSLDGLWGELQRAQATVAEDLPGRVAAEEERRETARAAKQSELDKVWAKLQANDPAVTLPALKRAFADSRAPAAAVRCEGNRTVVVLEFGAPDAIVRAPCGSVWDPPPPEAATRCAQLSGTTAGAR